MKLRLLMVSGGVLTVAFASPAIDQAIQPAVAGRTDGADSADPSPDTENGAASAEIIVARTGVVRAGYDPPTPTTMLNSKDMQDRGITNVAAPLNEVPAFGGSVTPSMSSRTAQNAGGNFVDLRGFGAARALVLIDRRRHVPTTARGQVDINVIPSARQSRSLRRHRTVVHRRIPIQVLRRTHR